ncbi:hypothetical protein PBI_LAUER_31 [Gordonia phage Lauer]|uniref:Uncharacterized protein n=1 Tax=Gordonia phage Lauer TaxID=2656538 RepID=A0A649VID4_9CAUD|nr:hypothetical protein PP995_gp31 [Gordonia phage Lauer]QGJ92140.1 hypothetical protein PBI_LAUER_31 [Gordonia phage Lauer]
MNGVGLLDSSCSTHTPHKEHIMSKNNCVQTFTLANGETVTCNRKAAPRREVSGHEQVCLSCFEAWMMENDHNDTGHDGAIERNETVAGCPECGTYDPRPTRKGHSANKGTKQVHRSHAACDHPSTPAARAKCRKARAAADNHFGDTPMQDEDNADVWENLPRDLLDAYEALTDKQKEQARARIADNEALPAGAKLTAHVAIALADRARFKKTTIAKLSKADVRSIIALALS